MKIKTRALSLAALPFLALTAGVAQAQSYYFVMPVKGLVAESSPIVADSCKSILDSGGSTGNGVYQITPNGGAEIDVYCDMTSSGGGWTMVVAQFETDPVTNWNEGIQSDYDPTLNTRKGFVVNYST